MNGSDHEVLVGTGKGPDGAAVKFYEVERPETVGDRGGQGFLVEARNAKGERITHSDSLAGLKSCGYTVDETAPTPAEDTLPPAPAKTIEDELV